MSGVVKAVAGYVITAFALFEGNPALAKIGLGLLLGGAAGPLRRREPRPDARE
jgi:hypothetical protein